VKLPAFNLARSSTARFDHAQVAVDLLLLLLLLLRRISGV